MASAAPPATKPVVHSFPSDLVEAEAAQRAKEEIRRKVEAELVAALPETKRALVRQRLLDYLGTNQNLLDMYLVPSSAIMKKMEMPILP